MPLRVYRCESGHESEHLLRMDDESATLPCLTCGEDARRILAARGWIPPDGTYSYEPNIGKPREG